ncbi:Mu transposase domain-containing protein [Streptomyces sp. NPDC053069]|uniref:Mu transposase domain-containing protein n=1 Tax=Streptomyces sp. NPDC053069 TaxID=3365695 RepID=UPI0037D66EF2
MNEIEPGEEAQIDYRPLWQWTNLHILVRPVLHLDQHAWTEAHVAAFRYFDGVPRRLVPDNLKTGVDKTDLYDPKINRAYAELAAHFGALANPARGSKPKYNPGCGGPCPMSGTHSGAGGSSPRSRTCRLRPSPGASRWPDAGSAGRRAGRPDGRVRCRRGHRAAAASAHPVRPARWSTATVGPDIHIKVGRILHSVPWKVIGRKVDVRPTAAMV